MPRPIRRWTSTEPTPPKSWRFSPAWRSARRSASARSRGRESTTLELADLKYADELGYTVKLLAVAKLVDGQLEMHVQPTLVHHDRPLAQCGGAFNMIALEGDAVGKTWYSGAGAGQMPTASAVVADLIDMATGRAALTFPRIDVWQERQPFPVQPPQEVANRYYLRFNVLDRPHVFADIADILGRNGISLASIIQHEAPEDERGRIDRAAGGDDPPHDLRPPAGSRRRARPTRLAPRPARSACRSPTSAGWRGKRSLGSKSSFASNRKPHRAS